MVNGLEGNVSDCWLQLSGYVRQRPKLTVGSWCLGAFIAIRNWRNRPRGSQLLGIEMKILGGF
jgi:hypothetical protein